MGRPTQRNKAGRSNFTSQSGPGWRYDESRFGLGSSPRDSADDRAEKERLIAAFLAKKQRRH